MTSLFCSFSCGSFVLFYQLWQLYFVLSAVTALFCSISCDSFVMFYQLWQLCFVLSAVTASLLAPALRTVTALPTVPGDTEKITVALIKKGTMLYSAKYNLNHRIKTGGSGCDGINPRALYSSRHFILVENIHANQSEILSKCLSVKSINWL